MQELDGCLIEKELQRLWSVAMHVKKARGRLHALFNSEL